MFHKEISYQEDEQTHPPGQIENVSNGAHGKGLD
jgi:hypothetical protein